MARAEWLHMVALGEISYERLFGLGAAQFRAIAYIFAPHKDQSSAPSLSMSTTRSPRRQLVGSVSWKRLIEPSGMRSVYS